GLAVRLCERNGVSRVVGMGADQILPLAFGFGEVAGAARVPGELFAHDVVVRMAVYVGLEGRHCLGVAVVARVCATEAEDGPAVIGLGREATLVVARGLVVATEREHAVTEQAEVFRLRRACGETLEELLGFGIAVESKVDARELELCGDVAGRLP